MRARRATAEDLPRLVELLAQDELGSTREVAGGPVDPGYVAAFDAIHSDPNNAVLVGEDDDEVVCMLQLTFLPHLTFRGGWRAQIEGVRVAADRRGQGLGRQLIARAVDEARAHGCHLVQLTTNTSRSDTRRFYESLGFEATHHGMKLYLTGSVGGRPSPAQPQTRPHREEPS